jgi:hypothetical protein
MGTDPVLETLCPPLSEYWKMDKLQKTNSFNNNFSVYLHKNFTPF